VIEIIVQVFNFRIARQSLLNPQHEFHSKSTALVRNAERNSLEESFGRGSVLTRFASGNRSSVN
jgi:hypothetical protein